ncbi:MAG: glycosyltransferase family 39 protein [Melioribacteraceae bacterium]|nr:glycosyltransferase family 39 protein [Melioribacteraceae bacterium]
MNLKELFENKEAKFVLAIIVLGFIIRLGFVIETSESPFVEHLFSDSKIYIDYADKMVKSGDWLGSEPYFMAPAYPYFLALFRLISSDSTLLIRITQAVISSLTLLFIFLAARNIFNKHISIIALLIGAVFGSYVLYSGLIFSETLQIFFISIFIYYLTNRNNSDNSGHWVLSGAFLGAAGILRANILLFLPVFVIYMLFSKNYFRNIRIGKYKAVSAFIFGAVLIISPVTIRNYIVSGELVPITSNGGINFYIANNNNAQGVFVTPRQFDYAHDMSGRKYASKITGANLNNSEASDYWLNKTLDEIAEAPGRFALLYVKKILMFFNNNEFPQSSIINYEFYQSEYSDVLKLPLIRYSLLSLLFLIGFMLYLKYPKKESGLIIFIVVYILATALFFVNGRFRLGITPAIIIISSFGIYNIYEHIKQSRFRELKVPAFILSAFIIFSYFFFEVPKFTNYDAYLQLGNIAQFEGRYTDAIYNYNKSLLIEDKVETYLNIGNTFSMMNDGNNALAAYREAEKLDSTNYLVHFNKGLLLNLQNRSEEALQSYFKAYRLNPDFAPPLRNIGLIYFINQNYDIARDYFKKFIEISDDEQQKSATRMDLDAIERLQKKRPNE